ncbi:DUF4245 domain-containing protein [Paractinoplanes rhizophilus]|uniref:DUF4245 domain-containing protein n=1 Tax=Paractinoplanes rhizophilus TaxID=1416877 RepID=A0ABW2HU43_9ACTN
MEPAPRTQPASDQPPSTAAGDDAARPASDDATHPVGGDDGARPVGGDDAARPVAGDDAAVSEGNPRLGRGGERSPRDMVMSLAVLLVPIALLLIFYRVVLSGDAPITVDPAPTIQEAQHAAAFTVVVPQGLGDDWHTSSATFKRQSDGATLRLGYVDPDKDPVQLVESSVPTATLLPGELGENAKALGNFRSPAGVWRVYDGRPGEKALVLADQSRTIVVVGKTDMKNLETLATSLR